MPSPTGEKGRAAGSAPGRRDEWLTTSRRPAAATDRCFTAAGAELGRGSRVWDGILNSRADGVCTATYPLHSTSRIVAGGPLRGGVYKCALQPVGKAIARGLYGSWRPSAAERERLEQIFPTGVCDYTPRKIQPRSLTAASSRSASASSL